ncbi:MAG: AraC family ligand binding domain-containing protein, partial [Coprobacillus cateniformis]|nr:AraC family ligand binding domain-containing protein [Coprobacillus cateniformis]
IKEVLLRDYPFKDIKPLLCGEEKCRNGHAFGPATRPYYLLHYVLSGKGRFESSRGSYNVKQGEIFVIHPFEVTYYEADQNMYHDKKINLK